MRELALFAGAGGGILGSTLLGWRTVCAVEINAYCARRLLQRQNEGHLPPFPIWDDVRTFDGRPWQGIVDVVSGGFPCQDISIAGYRAGIEGEKSGLWREMARIIREVRPRYAFVENSPNLTTRGLGRVLGDLAEMGYDARWGVLSAEAFGAWHLRERIWIVADFDRKKAADFIGAGLERRYEPTNSRATFRESVDGVTSTQECGDRVRATWWDVEPRLVRMVYGMANRVDRIQALGNGQVPAVVAGAWETLSR